MTKTVVVNIVKICIFYVGLAMLLLSSAILLLVAVPYITSVTAGQQNVLQWSGFAMQLAFFIALIGSIIAICIGRFLRRLYIRLSLIVCGAIYIASWLPVLIFNISRSAIPLYQSVLLTIISLLPGMGCITGGILFRKRPLRNRGRV
jgi:hypothetical protein